MSTVIGFVSKNGFSSPVLRGHMKYQETVRNGHCAVDCMTGFASDFDRTAHFPRLPSGFAANEAHTKPINVTCGSVRRILQEALSAMPCDIFNVTGGTMTQQQAVDNCDGYAFLAEESLMLLLHAVKRARGGLQIYAMLNQQLEDGALIVDKVLSWSSWNGTMNAFSNFVSHLPTLRASGELDLSPDRLRMTTLFDKLVNMVDTGESILTQNTYALIPTRMYSHTRIYAFTHTSSDVLIYTHAFIPTRMYSHTLIYACTHAYSDVLIYTHTPR